MCAHKSFIFLFLSIFIEQELNTMLEKAKDDDSKDRIREMIRYAENNIDDWINLECLSPLMKAGITSIRMSCEI